MPMGGYKSVKVDQFRDPIRRPVSYARRDHAAVAMADQGDLTKVFKVQDAENILYVSFKIIRGACQMRALAQARVGRREN